MSYAYKRSITVDKTKVPNTDQNDFPVLVSGVYTYLKVAGSGGNVQSSSGYDIAFFSDSGLTSQLPHEVERWVDSTGEFIAWVRVDLSTSVDTVFYIAYGDSSISSSQEDIAGVWSGTYINVWHLGNGTTPSGTDSAGLTNLSTIGTVAQPLAYASGKIDGATEHAPKTTPFTPREWGGAYNANHVVSQITVSAWIKTAASGVYSTLLSRDNNSSVRAWNFRLDNSNKIELLLFISSAAKVAASASDVNTGAWLHVAGTYDGSYVRTYINGAVNGTPLAATGSIDPATNLGIVLGGLYDGANPQYQWYDYLDEVRFASGAKSADWLATEYNNQSDPSTFYEIGEETPNSSPLTDEQSDSISLSDAINAILHTVFSQDDTIELSDEIQSDTIDYYTDPSDTLELSDEPTYDVWTFLPSLDDTIELSDGVENYYGIWQVEQTVVDDDELDFEDGIAIQFFGADYFFAVDELLPHSKNARKDPSYDHVQFDIGYLFTDSLSLSDSIDINLKPARAAYDTLQYNYFDSIELNLGGRFLRDFSDSFSLSDSLATAGQNPWLFASPSDSLSLSDSYAIASRPWYIFGDTLTLFDWLLAILSLQNSQSDSLSLSDAISIQLNDAPLYSSLNDTLSLSDAISLYLRANQTAVPTDSLSLSDEVYSSYIVSYISQADTLALSDAVATSLVSIVIERSLADTISLSDNVVTQMDDTQVDKTDTEGDLLTLLDAIQSSLLTTDNVLLEIGDSFSLTDTLVSRQQASDLAYMRRYLNDVIR